MSTPEWKQHPDHRHLEFERWAESVGDCLEKDENEEYISEDTIANWAVWKAAWDAARRLP